MDEAFGGVIAGALPDELTLPIAIAVWRAVTRHRDYTGVEARLRDSRAEYTETLIVDCENDGVPTKNVVGIEYRERLGLKFYRESDRLPEVYALRADFPVTPHQNDTPTGSFRSLCIYLEPWSTLRRTWTPEKHLQRIMWWLAETASGTLHRPDQPLEQLYFQSPIELVLPYDFADRVGIPGNQLVVERSAVRGPQRFTLIGKMVRVGELSAAHNEFPCLALPLSPIVHGPVEQWPHDLGALHDQLERRGASFAKALFDGIKGCCNGSRFPNSSAGRTLLILSIPLLRQIDREVERTDVMGIVAQVNIGELGVATGALD